MALDVDAVVLNAEEQQILRHAVEQQLDRAYRQYKERSTDVGKNTFMASLKDQNEVLYFMLIQQHLKEMFPVRLEVIGGPEGSHVAVSE